MTVVAEPSKESVKCQNMTVKYTSKYLKQAEKATRAHDRAVNKLIAKHIAKQSVSQQPADELTEAIQKLVARYRPDEYKRVLIEEPVEEATTIEDGKEFRCRTISALNGRFPPNLRRYEDRLEEIESAVRERLEIETLDSDEGLVVISFYAHGFAQDIIINRLGSIGGGIKFGPIINDEYFRVLKVKAGTYEWHQIKNRNFFGRTTLHMKRADLNFTVEAGKLNYTGLFIYRSQWFKGRHANIHDRIAVVLTLLEQRYPELLDDYEISNGLNPDDRFIDFYLQEKQASKSEIDGA